MDAPTPLPGSPALLLVPTELEARRLRDLGGVDPGLALPFVCGFGPVAAAARTAQLLAQLKPRAALLVGIAGTYDAAALPVGEACAFGSVAIDGIGVGEGAALRAPRALGFPQWPGSLGTPAPAIFDRIELAGGEGPLLLTTCAAASDAEQARCRRERFPDALAEDMEGFAVAFACALAGVPLRIVRGVSNEVGDREPGRWRIPAALAAARRLALELLTAPAPGSAAR